MHEETDLVEKLRKIEALFASPGTPGERDAAAGALDRIRGRLSERQRTEKPVEYRFSLTDRWSRSLFLAILNRYGLRSYRYSGQRRTTVMVRVLPSFVDDTLWPEFQQLSGVLQTHLEQITQRVITEAFGVADTEPELRNHPNQLEAAGQPHEPSKS